MSDRPDFLKLKNVAIVVGVGAIYLAAAKLGLSLAFLNASVSPVWPPTGFAIAVCLLLGYRAAPGVLLGALAANYLLTDVSFATAAAISVGNTLEAVAAVYFLRHFAESHNPFNRAFDVLKFVLFAAILSPAISASIGNFALCISGAESWSQFSWLWLTWWSGDGVGALIITPFILSWLERPVERWRATRWLEFSSMLALLALLSTMIYTNALVTPGRPWGHVTIPILVWAAFRFGPRGVSTALATVSIIAIWGTVHGFGGFAVYGKNESLLFLQAYVADLAITILSLAAIVTERKLAGRHLAGSLSVTRILTESLALPDALPRILQRICRTFEWEVGVMWTLDDRLRELRCLKVFPSRGPSASPFEKLCYERTFVPGVGLPGRVWESRRPAWIPDVSADDNFPRANAAAAEELHAAFGFPIMSGERFLGVMEFFSHEIRKPDRGLLETFAGIGNQIGQFIESKGVEDEREQLLYREQTARNQAEQANRLKDEFLATLSHELRTPLTAMLGWVKMLRTGRLDGETTSHALETIERNAKAQAQLIEDLIDVSRITGGKLKLDMQRFNLSSLITAAVDIVRPVANANNVAIEVALEAGVGEVSGDPARLQQVIWNLLSNAVKFTPPNGHVYISLRRVESFAEVEVRDTGIGIDPDFLPKVFERFRQAESPVTRSHRGLGLGLAIVRHLTELHGGSVAAHSDGEGRGAKFTIRIPIAESQIVPVQPLQTAELDSSQTKALAGVRIMLVEDEVDARELLLIALEVAGAKVKAVASAQEALHDFASFKPHVLLSDVGLPHESGYDLVRKLRLSFNSAKVPAIALTAFASEKDRDLALSAGFQIHLAKPVDPAILIKTISTLIEQNGRRDK